MGKKKRTPAQLRADKARSLAMKAKLTQKPQDSPEPIKVQPEPTIAPPIEEESEDQMQEVPTMMGNEELLAQINELKKNQELLQAALLNKEGTQISDRGVEGTRTKYDLEASSYPDYTERLAKEGRLQRFGFGENYRLFYEVNKSRYQRADGIWEQQPRFVYQLWGRRIDPDTGEFIVTTDAKSGLKVESLYGINRYIFHEDPDSFRDVAENEGLDFTTLDFDYILAEARYIQVRDWLLGCFYPEAARPSENRKEMVIGNKLVEVKEVAVEANTNVKFDFSNMKKL